MVKKTLRPKEFSGQRTTSAHKRWTVSCNMKPILLGAILLISSLSVAAPLSDPFLVQSVAYVEVKGVIRDGRTSAPIAGASVLALWTAATYSNNDTYGHCLRIAAAQTDAEGRFSITTPEGAVFRRGLAQQFVDIRIHKAGWDETPSDNGSDGRTMRMDDEETASVAAFLQGGKLTLRHLTLSARMFPSTQDSSDRLQGLRDMSSRREDCETYGSHSDMQSYFDGIADEANSLARTKYEKALGAVMTTRARRAFDPVWPVKGATSAIMDAVYRAPELNDLERRDREDKTPLMNAAEAGNVAQVTSLLQQGANPNRTRRELDLISPDSALTLAMKKYLIAKGYKSKDADKYLVVIEALVSNSATDPNLRNRPYDYTPLMKALSLDEVEVVDLLLKAGADPNLTAYHGDYSALQIAAEHAANGQPAAAKQFSMLLASKKVNLDLVTTYLGFTALTYAASMAETDIVTQLLEAGADPNGPSRGGITPLLHITINALGNPKWPKYVETFKVIASWPGVRMDATYQGKTALQMVTEAGRTDLEQILLGNRK